MSSVAAAIVGIGLLVHSVYQAPASVPATGTLTEADVRSVLADTGWPDTAVDAALAVTWCESRWQPDAYNASGATGLFQLMPFWAPAYGYTVDALGDPYVNARVAELLWEDAGWQPWVCEPS